MSPEALAPLIRLAALRAAEARATLGAHDARIAAAKGRASSLGASTAPPPEDMAEARHAATWSGWKAQARRDATMEEARLRAARPPLHRAAARAIAQERILAELAKGPDRNGRSSRTR